MTALAARVQSFGDRRDRYALFDALRDLEDRASTEGASGSTLRKIAEIRFFAGILREAVRPFPLMSLRTVLRVCGSGDRRVGRSAIAERET